MKLRKLIHPVLALTVGAMLYTGCGRKGKTYILLPPQTIVYKGDIPMSENDTASIKAMYIDVTIPGKEVILASNLLFPGNSAYALSVPEPTNTLIEKISDIRIRPVIAYNSEYLQLEDMTKACSFASFSKSNDWVPKDTMLMYLDGFNVSYTELKFVVRLTVPPSDLSTHQFIVEIITENNSRLADTTQKITLSL